MNQRTQDEEQQCQYGHRWYHTLWDECPKCQGDRNRALTERTNEHIRALKDAMAAGQDMRADHEAKQLRHLGHPDVDALIRAIKARLQDPKGSKRTKPRLDDQ